MCFQLTELELYGGKRQGVRAILGGAQDTGSKLGCGPGLTSPSHSPSEGADSRGPWCFPSAKTSRRTADRDLTLSAMSAATTSESRHPPSPIGVVVGRNGTADAEARPHNTEFGRDSLDTSCRPAVCARIIVLTRCAPGRPAARAAVVAGGTAVAPLLVGLDERGAVRPVPDHCSAVEGAPDDRCAPASQSGKGEGKGPGRDRPRPRARPRPRRTRTAQHRPSIPQSRSLPFRKRKVNRSVRCESPLSHVFRAHLSGYLVARSHYGVQRAPDNG
eukprot:scaffold123984_cov30-Tisochrysis_lutea.AAC.1